MQKLISILILLIFPYVTLACGCAGIYKYEDATSDFIGKVVRIERVVDENEGLSYEITFRVKWVIKGQELVTKTTVVQTPCLNDACCGYNFIKGKKYRVFTIVNGNSKLYTGFCQMPYQIDCYRKPFAKGFLKKPKENIKEQ